MAAAVPLVRGLARDTPRRSRWSHISAPLMFASVAGVLFIVVSTLVAMEHKAGERIRLGVGMATRGFQSKLLTSRQARGGIVMGKESRMRVLASPKRYDVPSGPERTASQAFEAVKRGVEDGKMRQRIELMLPLIGATDLDDWPGGIRQQFKAASPMVEQILTGLKKEMGISGSISAKILDQGDAVASWTCDKLTAVLFPTAETLEYIEKELASKTDGSLFLLINPQWNKGGSNVISDFGWGQKKVNAENLIQSFDYTYSFEQRKQNGANIKLLKSYPQQWAVLETQDDRTFNCIGTADERPSYQAVDEMLKKAYPEENIFSRFMREMEQKKDSGFF
mmetsp:Transcript_20767/g.36971  ORF Transcript_20767/g.36971 Transcript_20767/m.36971 type:complete len:337 (-) Transcript_20767:333-1343(-)